VDHDVVHAGAGLVPRRLDAGRDPRPILDWRERLAQCRPGTGPAVPRGARLQRG
jgi:hypothetical protein